MIRRAAIFPSASLRSWYITIWISSREFSWKQNMLGSTVTYIRDTGGGVLESKQFWTSCIDISHRKQDSAS